MIVAAAPTRTGLVRETYGGVRLELAALRKFVDAPSSSVTRRAALSAATAAACAVPGRATSVVCSNGVVPVARPTSPYWFVEKVLETVRSPVGWKSIDSSASRSASVAGQAPETGVTAAAASSSFVRSVAAATEISVRPLNSLTAPVTWTCSPIVTEPTVADENTKTASDAPGVVSGPGVWIT